MSESSAFGFGQFVPGFDFLQNLSKTAAQASPVTGAVPGMASWVAPTLSVEELDKRIQELKAVQFWLDQNATALKASIQAMEVQKMTLSTLQSMNVNMADLAKAFTAKSPATETSPEAAPENRAHRSSVPNQAPKPLPSQSPLLSQMRARWMHSKVSLWPTSPPSRTPRPRRRATSRRLTRCCGGAH